MPLSQVTVDLTNPFHGLSHILLGHYLVAIPGKGQFYKWALDYGLQKFAPFIRDDNIYYRLAKLAIVFTAAAALDMAIILAVSDWAMETSAPVSTSGSTSVYEIPYSVVQIAIASLGFQLPALGYDWLKLHEANAVRVVKGSNKLITAFPIYDDNLPDVIKQQPPAATVRQGFAGLGGALQGYTFDVLTRQWVTDYEFFVLAHGGTLPGGSGSGAGNGSSNGNSGGSGSGGTGSGK